MKLKAALVITVIILVALGAVIFWTMRSDEEVAAVKERNVAGEQAKETSRPEEVVPVVSPAQKEDESVSASASESASDGSEETDADDEKPDVSEQQRRYEVLAQFLPRYFELNKLINEIDSQRPSPDDVPDGLSSLERIHWYQQKAKPWKEKYGEQLRTFRIEKKAMQTALEEHFPEAAGAVYLDDGGSRFSLNLTKLRELVGGSLPSYKE